MRGEATNRAVLGRKRHGRPEQLIYRMLSVLAQLRAYSRRSGLPLSVIVTEAIEKRLTATRRRGRHG